MPVAGGHDGCCTSLLYNCAMDAALQSLLDEVFDQALVYHGFTDYMRDYEIITLRLREVRGTCTPDHLHDLHHLLRVDTQPYRPRRRFTLDHQRASREPPKLAERRLACADVAQICREFTKPRPRPARLPSELASGSHPARAVSASLIRPVGPGPEEDCFPCPRPSSCPPRSPCGDYCPDHHARECTDPRNHARSKTGGQLIAKGSGAPLI